MGGSSSQLRTWLPPSSDEGQPDITITALLLGMLIGVLICFTNLYLGLQTGWISMMSLQAVLIGFLLSRLLPIPLTPQQLILVQTTAVAAGTMPLAAGFVGVVPALGLLTVEHDGMSPVHLSWVATVGWSCAVAYFGVFLSPPLRARVVVEEQLVFPSGTATAQLISVLYSLPPIDTSKRQRIEYHEIPTEEPIAQESGDDDRESEEREAIRNEGWCILLWSFAVSSGLTLMAYFFPVVFSIPIFGSYLAEEWLWYLTPSLSYVGQGIIMGLPTTLSINLGMLVGWGVLSPISKLSGWAPGPTGDMDTGARGWILWTCLAIMCIDSLVSLTPIIFEAIINLLPRPATSEDPAHKISQEIEPENRLVPWGWVICGLGFSVVLGVVLVWVVFGSGGIKPWATIVAFLMGGFISIFAVRTLGETDVNPASALGKLSQLVFAWIQPGNIAANLIAGGIAEAGAQQAGDLMQDLKTGHLLQASPRTQFYGQLIGSSLSILVTTAAYSLYTNAYTIPGPAFPAPSAYIWLSLARLLRGGNLPKQSASFMTAFAIVFGLVSACKIYATHVHFPYVKWIPSGAAFAAGFFNTPSLSLARLAGGIIEHIHRTRFAKGRGDVRIIVMASGFVLVVGGVSVGPVLDAHERKSGHMTPKRFFHVMLDRALSSIRSLTFYKDEVTLARRSSPIPQLACIGKACKLYTPDVIRCQNVGGEGTDVDWKCEADLPQALRFGRVEVSCEGWSRPGDPYVLKGSCGLEYRLIQVPKVLHEPDSHISPKSWDLYSIAFTILWGALICFLLYAFLKPFLWNTGRNNTTGSAPRPRPPSSGWFPGSHMGSDPPPPYTYPKPDSGGFFSTGWTPGFWTGAALGGLGGSLFNRNTQPGWDWERERLRQNTATSSSWFSGWERRRNMNSDDRGEGSSRGTSLGSMRQSTGLGGSKVR